MSEKDKGTEVFLKIKKTIINKLENNDIESLKMLLTKLEDKKVTKQILKETGVGKVIFKLNKHEDPSIQKISNRIVAYWKTVIDGKEEESQTPKELNKSIDQEKRKLQESPESINTEEQEEKERAPVRQRVKIVKDKDGKEKIIPVAAKPKKSATTDSIKSIPSVPSRSLSSSSVGYKTKEDESGMEKKIKTINPKDVKERFPENDGIEFQPYEESYRNTIRRVMYSSLGRGTDIDREVLLTLIDELELEVWKRFEGDKNAYSKALRTINFHLRDFDNPVFNQKILSGEYTPHQVAYMESKDMMTEERRQESEMKLFKAQQELEIGTKPMATTDMFKCGKCKNRKTTYYQKQIRSADEPMTTFVTCVVCNHNWKFC